MRKLLTLGTFICFSPVSHGQQKLSIPEFKNLNSGDKYPSNTFLSSYANQFEIVISLKNYSAWGPDNHIKILGHHTYGWYEIEINRDEGEFDRNNVCYSAYKINDTIGKLVWETLLQNHLFDMKDERQYPVETCPPIIIDTIIENGGKQIISRGNSGSDMPEFEFEILTSQDYKKLYFYSPHEKLDSCPKANELKWIVNSITIFEKYLGR